MTDWRVSLGRPCFAEPEERAIISALHDAQISSGPKCTLLEERIGAYLHKPHAVCTNSGTSALWAILKAMKIRGEVICPSFTFAATANAIIQAGAKPVFADIEPRTCGLSTYSVNAAITENTEAIMLVHFAGMPAIGAPRLYYVARKRRLFLIEDCAEALGTWNRKGRRAGTHGQATALSFFPTKNITCGEGGMALFQNQEVADYARRLVAHGIQRDKDKPWKRDTMLAGMNMRLSDILASVALEQFKRLSELNEQRRQTALQYDNAFRGTPIDPLWNADKDLGCSYQMYTAYWLGTRGAISFLNRKQRDKLVLGIREQGVEASVHFDPPIHQHAYYQSMFNRKWELPNTEAVSASIFTLPMYPQMTAEDIETVLTAVRKAVENV